MREEEEEEEEEKEEEEEEKDENTIVQHKIKEKREMTTKLKNGRCVRSRPS